MRSQEAKSQLPGLAALDSLLLISSPGFSHWGLMSESRDSDVTRGSALAFLTDHWPSTGPSALC